MVGIGVEVHLERSRVMPCVNCSVQAIFLDFEFDWNHSLAKFVLGKIESVYN